MFEESVARPVWIDLEEPPDVAAETRRENAEERVRFSGPGAELLRQAYITRLRAHMEAFYEHGNLPDLVVLCHALELAEQANADGARRQAPVLESFLGLLGVEPLKALKSAR